MPILRLADGRRLQYALYGAACHPSLPAQSVNSGSTPSQSGASAQPHVSSLPTGSSTQPGFGPQPTNNGQFDNGLKQRHTASATSPPSTTHQQTANPSNLHSSASVRHIIYHHGWPSCRREAALAHAAAAALGFSVIAINRPGVGATDMPSQGLSYGSVADDVRQLLDSFGIHSVIQMGISGGGPYACACAFHLPHRTSALGLVASMTHTCGPNLPPGILKGMDFGNWYGYNMINSYPCVVRLGLAIVMNFPGIKRLAAALAPAGEGEQSPAEAGWSPGEAEPSQSSGDGRSSRGAAAAAAAARTAAAGPAGVQATQTVQQHAAAAGSVAPEPPVPEAGAAGRPQSKGWLQWLSTPLKALAFAGMAAPDKAAIAAHPEIIDVMRAGAAEIVAQGSRGLYKDMRLTSLPWDFDIKHITAPTLIFQGRRDINVTVGMAKYFEQHIPAARLTLYDNDSHMSLPLNHMGEILSGLVAAAQIGQPIE